MAVPNAGGAKIRTISRANVLRLMKNENYGQLLFKSIHNGDAQRVDLTKKFIYGKIVRTDKCGSMALREISSLKSGKILSEICIVTLKNGYCALRKMFTVHDECLITGFSLNDRIIIGDNLQGCTVYKVKEEQCISGNSAIALDQPSTASSGIYEYTKLNDLTVGNKAYLFGVVKSVSMKNSVAVPLVVHLTDESIGFQNSVRFLICGSTDIKEKIDNFDILRLHRVKIDLRDDKLEGCGTVGKTGFHFLIFNGELGGNFKRSTSTNWTFPQSDYDRIQELRTWISKYRNEATANARNPQIDKSVRLADFTKNYSNLFVQAIGVGRSEPPHEAVILRVWDGTEFTINNEREKLEKIDNFADLSNVYCFDKRLNQKVGNLSVDIFVYDEYREKAQTIKAGDFVYLANVHRYFSIETSDDRNYKKYAITVHGGGDHFGRGISVCPPEGARVLASRLEIKLASLKRKSNDSDESGSFRTALEVSDNSEEESLSQNSVEIGAVVGKRRKKTNESEYSDKDIQTD